jgi:hypothetical protein
MCKQTLQVLREIRPYKMPFCKLEGIGFRERERDRERERGIENKVNTGTQSILLKMLPY